MHTGASQRDSGMWTEIRCTMDAFSKWQWGVERAKMHTNAFSKGQLDVEIGKMHTDAFLRNSGMWRKLSVQLFIWSRLTWTLRWPSHGTRKTVRFHNSFQSFGIPDCLESGSAHWGNAWSICQSHDTTPAEQRKRKLSYNLFKVCDSSLLRITGCLNNKCTSRQSIHGVYKLCSQIFSPKLCENYFPYVAFLIKLDFQRSKFHLPFFAFFAYKYHTH